MDTDAQILELLTTSRYTGSWKKHQKDFASLVRRVT